MYFLERIAKLLHDKYDGDIGNHCLVFPNRRAGLYFLKYYAKFISKPVWTPSVMTISEFFGSLSELTVAENEILLFELYREYRELNRNAESFDAFYFWGDMLLNDFDDADKYMADASSLFRNVQDYKTIDEQFGDIEPEKAEIIKRFWRNYEPEKQTREKDGFKMIWVLLSDLYNGFRKRLTEGRIAYEGMLCREVAERSIRKALPELKWDLVHFIGFNALNRCELTVMKNLQDVDRARFYWDYDNSYISRGKLNSAGFFMTRNLSIFRNDMPGDWSYDTLLSSKNPSGERVIIETTSDIAQVKLIPYLLNGMPAISADDAHHTAVILADENLIIPVLSSVPGSFGDINVTMGYPLKMTNVYSLVKNLLNLQRNILSSDDSVSLGYKEVLEILKHDITADLFGSTAKDLINEITEKNLIRIPSQVIHRSELLSSVFRKTESPEDLAAWLRDILSLAALVSSEENDGPAETTSQDKLRNEFVFTVLKAINRLEPIIRSPDITLSRETYIRILDRILRTQAVAFSGEPLSGIQIMGFLETRALDFRNIILLSVNEGVLPSVSSGSSFIPYSIREAFGLPVINHQESIYAYHFFRLLHRAENVRYIFNSDSTGLRTGEMSRFLIQMKYEHIGDLKYVNPAYDIKTHISVNTELKKSAQHIQRLVDLYTGPGSKNMFSPTSINTWLSCRMRFYYRYVCRLKEPEVITEQIDNAIFGQLLHGVMKNVYSSFINGEVSSCYIDSLIGDDKTLYELIDREINGCYHKGNISPLSGNDIIVREILHTYLKRILKADLAITPFIISGLEKLSWFEFEPESEGRNLSVRCGGNIDRIDIVKGTSRIVDYKTGSPARKVRSLYDLFEDDRSGDLDGWLQTLLYCEAFLHENPGIRVIPIIYGVRDIAAEKVSDTLAIREDKNQEYKLEDYSAVRGIFSAGLKNVISSIFDPREPFRMTGSLNKCGYCPYRGLCQR